MPKTPEKYLAAMRKYHKDNKDSIQKRQEKYRKDNREKLLAQKKKYYQKNKEVFALRNKNQHYKRKFGMTYDSVMEIKESQDYRCLICNAHEDELNASLSLDHCHETNQVRGFLCMKCNTAIGLLQDSPDLLSKAIDYLEK